MTRLNLTGESTYVIESELGRFSIRCIDDVEFDIIIVTRGEDHIDVTIDRAFPRAVIAQIINSVEHYIPDDIYYPLTHELRRR